MQHLKLENITLVCHDWGGPTGLSYALSHQDKIRALVYQ
jgi:haloalkane dehalogenase